MPQDARIPINRAAAHHALLREKLLRDFDLDENDEALPDTLDGISDFKELCAAALREARRREEYAAGIKSIIDENKARQKRHEEAAERIRASVLAAMIEAGEKKIEAPDMTVSVRAGKPKLVMLDDAPRDWCRVKEIVEPDKPRITAAIEAGEFIEFAKLSNAEPSLTIRNR